MMFSPHRTQSDALEVRDKFKFFDSFVGVVISWEHAIKSRTNMQLSTSPSNYDVNTEYTADLLYVFKMK